MESRQKLKSKANFKDEKEKMLEIAGKIEETDEMKLKMLAGLDIPDPDDVIYPAELNAHLIEQLKVIFKTMHACYKISFNEEKMNKLRIM